MNRRAMPGSASHRVEAAGFVLLGLAALVFLVTQLTHHHWWEKREPAYRVTAVFQDVGELRVGARVSMSGVDVGRVLRIDLNPARQVATVLLAVNAKFDKIPSDSDASINTQGVLGGKFIRITNGASRTYLHDGGRISSTHSAASIETLLNGMFTHYKKSRTPDAAAPGGASP